MWLQNLLTLGYLTYMSFLAHCMYVHVHVRPTSFLTRVSILCICCSSSLSSWSMCSVCFSHVLQRQACVQVINNKNIFSLWTCVWGGAVASWLVHSTPEWALRVRALAGDIVLCSWARHFTLTVPLSTQVYKWVPANLVQGVTLRWTSIPSRGE